MKQNMVAYKIDTVNNLDIKIVEEHLQVFFLDDNDDIIPAARCQDYFSEEIKAESNSESNKNFYSDLFSNDPTWICPDIETIKFK